MAAPVPNFTTPPPYRISRVASKNSLAYEWEVTSDAVLRFWQERIGGLTRAEGTRRRHLGVVCGLDIRCGDEGSVALGAPAGTLGESGTLSHSEFASEGDYRFGVDALDDDGLWSA